MKHGLTVLIGVAVSALSAGSAIAVSYGPELPRKDGGGFERWDRNDDGVIDKAEFRQMRKALNKQQAARKDKPKPDRAGKQRQARGGPGHDAGPMAGPAARRDDRRGPPDRGPAMRDDQRGDRRGKADRRSRSPGRRNSDARGPRGVNDRRPGRDLAGGFPCCPGCDCANGDRCECMAAGRGGPKAPGFDGTPRGMRRGPGMRGHRRMGRHDGPGFGPGRRRLNRDRGGVMMPPRGDGPPLMRRHHRHGDRAFDRMGPVLHDHGRHMGPHRPRVGWRLREMARRLHERFGEHADRIAPREPFPDRFRGPDRRDDDRRREDAERRDAHPRRDGDGPHGRFDEPGPDNGRDADDDRPRGPRGREGKRLRGARTSQTRAI